MALSWVPLEESRSRRIHLPDPDGEEDSMQKCLVETPASLIATVLPRTTRPIRMVDPGRNSRVSPGRGPWTITSFRGRGSIVERVE